MEKLKIDKWFVLQIVHSLCKRKTSVCKGTDFNWKTSIIRLLFHQIRDFQYYQIGSSKTFVLPNSCYLWKIIIEYQFVIQLLIPQSFSYKERYQLADCRSCNYEILQWKGLKSYCSYSVYSNRIMFYLKPEMKQKNSCISLDSVLMNWTPWFSLFTKVYQSNIEIIIQMTLLIYKNLKAILILRSIKR